MMVLKKIGLLTFVFSLGLLFSPCVYAANKSAASASATSDAQGKTSAAQTKKEARDVEKANKQAANAQKKSARREKKGKKEAESFDDLYGSADSNDYMAKGAAFSSKTIEVADGRLKILMKGSLGSFQFYALDDDEKATPLLSGNDEFTSSFYALRVGKKDYKLANSIGVVLGAREIENGGQMVYAIPNVARVIATYEFVSSSQGEPKDILKITASVLNRGKKTDAFSLKTVLDTYLGEQKGPHFSTADTKKINKEMQFRKVDSARWIASGNDKASMQIVIYGADVTVPEVVSLANKDLISMPAWIPNVNGTKNFDSVISYNNSGVCINWASVTLAPEEEASFVYYIAVATEDETPQGEKFINDFETFSSFEKEAGGAADQNDKNGVGSSQMYIEPEKLSREYVQSLIDRINALENDGQMVDRSEIMMLNAELDLILETLRQM